MDLSTRIREILLISDLSVVTAKQVRKQLEEGLGYTLEKEKTNELIYSILNDIQKERLANGIQRGNDSFDKPDDHFQQSAVQENGKKSFVPVIIPLPVNNVAFDPSTGDQFSKVKLGKRKAISSHIVDDDDVIQDDTLIDDEEYARTLQEEYSLNPSRSLRNKKPKNQKSKSGVVKSKERSNKGGFSMKYLVSPVLKEIIGLGEATRAECVKLAWNYIKEHSLQDQQDKRFIICDESLLKVTGGKKRVNAFSLSKFFSDHLYKSDEVVSSSKNATVKNSDVNFELGEEDDDSTHEEIIMKDKSLSNATKKVKTKTDKAKGGFAKPYIISDQLQKVVLEKELPRTQVVKKLWDYIKENNLQDPTDKRYIICDETLIAVLGKKRLSSFEMNKYLGKHLIDIDEVSD